MDRKKLLKVIRKDLSELNDIAEELAGKQEPAKYEVDFAISKSKIILQEFEILKDICCPPEQPSLKEESETGKSIAGKEEPSGMGAFIELDIAPVAAVQADIAPVAAVQADNAEADDSEASKSEEISENKTIADFIYHGKSLNDTITGDKKTIDQKLASSPLTRLHDAMGLNDRYLFIRELFNNDADVFAKAIEDLDGMERIEEAVEYLNGNFKWVKTDASIKFAGLVKRRFSTENE